MNIFSAVALTKRYGGHTAVDNVNIDVKEGEIHALIGPNGAGKSTVVNLLSGMVPADAGRIMLNESDITSYAPHARVHAGLSRCFQVTSIFSQMTVRENFLLAVQSHRGSSFKCFGARDYEASLQDEALVLAERVGVLSFMDETAGSLPHGTQRKVDVALALAARPKVLLLDEPMAGMGPDESIEMIRLIDSLRKETAVLLIEHDMDAVFQLADRISVLVYGRVLTSGTPEMIKNNAEVQAVYLGAEGNA